MVRPHAYRKPLHSLARSAVAFTSASVRWARPRIDHHECFYASWTRPGNGRRVSQHGRHPLREGYWCCQAHDCRPQAISPLRSRGSDVGGGLTIPNRNSVEWQNSVRSALCYIEPAVYIQSGRARCAVVDRRRSKVIDSALSLLVQLLYALQLFRTQAGDTVSDRDSSSSAQSRGFV